MKGGREQNKYTHILTFGWLFFVFSFWFAWLDLVGEKIIFKQRIKNGRESFERIV